MRHEHSRQVHLHHLIHSAVEEAELDEVLCQHPLSQLVHIEPGNPRTKGIHHGHSRLENCLVDAPLLLRELARDGERARDVARVAVVLVAHVVENHLRLPQLAVVGRSRMSVVKHRRVRAAAADGGVGLVAHPPVVVAVVEEDALHLVLHHARLHLAHHLDVRRAADPVAEPQHLELLVRLDHPRLVDGVVQHLPVDLVGLDAFKRGGGALRLAVRVDALVQVDGLGGEFGHEGGDFVHIPHRVDFVLLDKVFGRGDGPHPHRVLGREAGDEEGGCAALDVDGAQAVGLRHPKEVVEVALLPENLLVVRVIPRLALSAQHQRHPLHRLLTHQRH
mmetsp:Transcript_31304/g.61130  ORF Transcript_31304/g.61130 Transcript_31304/m.61130 type:complete len:334 (+) Transcript_31304:567-1568(+)